MSVFHHVQNRLVLPLIAMAVLTPLLVAISSTSASAGTAITGRLKDVSNGTSVSGQTIRLWSNDGGVPDEIVDTDTTDGAGNYSLTPPAAGPRYFIQLVAGRYQSGYLGHENNWFVRLGEQPQLWDPGTGLGPTFGLPAFMRGTVVNSATGNPVQGVLVTVRDVVTLEVLESDRTDLDGIWSVSGLTLDEYGIKVNGSSRGYETGFVGCGRGVVASWDDACSFGTGKVGRARLDRL